jgi:hypothetical protein
MVGDDRVNGSEKPAEGRRIAGRRNSIATLQQEGLDNVLCATRDFHKANLFDASEHEANLKTLACKWPIVPKCQPL